MATILLLHTNLVKRLDMKYYILKKLLIPFMVVRMYLSFSLLISVDSFFSDSHHKNMITSDLQLIKNKKTRKLLTKGLNIREP